DKRDNIVAALAPQARTVGIAWISLSAGRFGLLQTERANLGSELERLRPAEILLPEAYEAPAAVQRCALRRVPGRDFDAKRATELLCAHFGTHSLEPFGCEGLDAGVTAAGVV